MRLSSLSSATGHGQLFEGLLKELRRRLEPTV